VTDRRTEGRAITYNALSIYATLLRANKKQVMNFSISNNFLTKIGKYKWHNRRNCQLNVCYCLRDTESLDRDLWIFFSFESYLESNRPVLRQQLFTLYTYSEYLIHRYFVFVRNESDVWTTELLLVQFSHKTRQTMLLYAYFTPKVDFKLKFNHHQSFLYEWRLTVWTIRKFCVRPSIRIESRIGRTIRNRIESQQVPKFRIRIFIDSD